MTASNEATMDLLAAFERYARKFAAPARAKEAVAHVCEAGAYILLVRESPPRGLPCGSGAAEIHEPRAHAPRRRKASSHRKRVDVELQTVRTLGAAARALVVNDVHGAVRPEDDEVEPPAKDDRSAGSIVDGENERLFASQLGAGRSNRLRVRPAKKSGDARNDGVVLRVVGGDTGGNERTTRRSGRLARRNGGRLAAGAWLVCGSLLFSVLPPCRRMPLLRFSLALPPPTQDPSTVSSRHRAELFRLRVSRCRCCRSEERWPRRSVRETGPS